MKPIYLLLSIILGCMSCNKKSDNRDVEVEVVDINLERMHEILSDTIIESLTLIPLETNENCLITHVSKIKKYGDKVYVFDGKIGEILIFNMYGDFLDKVSHKGKGHGEYVMISDFDVHPQSGNIYVRDGMTGKILVFHGNKFLKDLNPSFGADLYSFCFLDENNIVFDNQLSRPKKGWGYQMIFTDNKFNVIDKKIPYEKFISLRMSPISPFSHVGDRVSYQPVYKDTIFHIEGSKLIPRYKLDFGNQWLDKDFLLSDKLDPLRFMRDLNKLDAINFLNTIESISHLFVYFTHKNEKYAYLYDKITKKGAFLKNYMRNGCGYNGLPIISDGDSFVGVVNPLELSNVNKDILQKYLKKKSLMEGDNPILSFIKFNKID